MSNEEKNEHKDETVLRAPSDAALEWLSFEVLDAASEHEEVDHQPSEEVDHQPPVSSGVNHETK